MGLLVKIEDYSHNVGTCYRCHNVVEPIISAQWFVKMEPLAREAMRVVKDGEVKFVPERFSKTYLNWMENVHDWCISRQLWWGHQIPAWYCADCGKMTVHPGGSRCLPALRQQEYHPGSRCAGYLVLLRLCGPSPRWAGRIRPRIWITSIPPMCWSPAMTSSSSGWPV